MSRIIERRGLAEKSLHANVDFYSASTYYAMGIDPDHYTPIFVVSRVSGWTAHILEQQANNRLIRPRAEYRARARRPRSPSISAERARDLGMARARSVRRPTRRSSRRAQSRGPTSSLIQR